MATHFVFVAGTDASADCSERNVVGGLVVFEGRREGEIDLQHSLVSLPINFVHALYPIVDGIHANVLNEGRAFLLTLYPQRLTQRPIFHQFYLDILRDIGGRCATHVCIADFPCWPSILMVVDKLLTNGRVDESAAVLDVVEIIDVAITID